ncbi:MAG: ectonucleotide pyrophosphatase/phosphodiesterase [Candidatus Kapaibacterium sp.]
MIKQKALIHIILFFTLIFSVNAANYTLVVSLDGFRWDYTEIYKTPNLDKIISRGVKARSLRPEFPTFTFPNHVSALTGMAPQDHGIIANHFFNPLTGDEYSYRNSHSIKEPEWYHGEFFWETAKKQGILSAAFFWPGSEMNDSTRRPRYSMKYDKSFDYRKRVDSVMGWLSLPHEIRPKFITLYFDAVDGAGHAYGPISGELFKAVALLDSIMGYLIERVESSALSDSLNLIVMSDHGMAEVDKGYINLSAYFIDDNLQFRNWGPLLMFTNIYGDSSLYNELKENEKGYRIYRKNDMPERLNFSHGPLIFENIMIAANGLLFKTDSLERKPIAGAHGYDNADMDMHGIFIAAGPDFKSGYNIGTMSIKDVYGLLCELFSLEPPAESNFNFEIINKIIKRK